MLNRIKEPSTWAGVSSILLGLGSIFNVHEAPLVADAVTSAAPSFISGNWMSGLLVLFGSAAVILKEKK